MNQNFIDTIYLFSCGSTGKTPKIDHELNIKEIFKLSYEQGIFPIVFLELKALCDNGNLYIDKQILDYCQKNVMHSVVNNIQRLDFVSGIIKQFNDAGIETRVLKGQVLARLYNTPETRISGDVDINIDEKYEFIACEILRKNGYKLTHRIAGSHHVFCQHPIYGILELHILLYYDFISDIWYDNKVKITEDYIDISTDDGQTIRTLGITDGLIYVTFHLIKHFLTWGVGIRQIMDTLLYMKHYKNEINWDVFKSIVKQLKYDKYIENILGLGVTYLGFNKEDFYDFSYDEDIIKNILLDIEAGGAFGHNELARKSFYEVYNKERYKTFKNGDFSKHITKQTRKHVFEAITFSNKNIFKRYSYAKKNKFLLPIAYMEHIIFIIKKAIKKKYIAKEFFVYNADIKNNKIIEKRMELVKKLDMI